MMPEIQCDGGVRPTASSGGDPDAVDGLKELRHVAGLPVSQTEPCPDIGTDVASVWGDVDCDGDVDSVDALKTLRFVAALSVSQTEPCPDIGAPEGGWRLALDGTGDGCYPSGRFQFRRFCAHAV